MPRFTSLLLLAVLIASTAPLSGQPSHARRPAPTFAPFADSLVRPARLCGTNSSRSRRCDFGHRDCLAAGKTPALCEQALSICHSCIELMVACQSRSTVPCGTCHERYGACMGPWIKIMDRD